MDRLLKDIRIPTIIKPGEMYIFSEDADRDWRIDCLSFAYLLTHDEEIVLALEMETEILSRECFDFKKFLGYAKISDDSHEFRFFCYDLVFMEDTVFSLYLHRMNSFQELLENE